jgi:patatin-like phospholipase/acyl hydrolase
MSNKDLCLLSLDDDEMRELSSLAILKRLMKIINSDASSKSCEYFDMMRETSTDELIAIMLDRLEMNIDECIDAYVALFDQVFRKKRHCVIINEHVQKRFDTEELKRSIREIVKRKNNADENALLKESENQQCKMLML